MKTKETKVTIDQFETVIINTEKAFDGIEINAKVPVIGEIDLVNDPAVIMHNDNFLALINAVSRISLREKMDNFINLLKNTNKNDITLADYKEILEAELRIINFEKDCFDYQNVIKGLDQTRGSILFEAEPVKIPKPKMMFDDEDEMVQS